MSDELKNSVFTSFSSECEGIFDGTSTPFRENPTKITVTVYEDGMREVGCSYLNRKNGVCLAITTETEDINCRHLFPVTQKSIKEPKSTEQRKSKRTVTVDKLMLNYLINKPNLIVPLQELREEIWGDYTTTGIRPITSALYRLRRQGANILTVHKKGLILKAPLEQ